MALKSWFSDLRARVLLEKGVRELRRIANALEEANLARSGPRGVAFRTLYEDRPGSPEEADLQFPSDEYFAEVERLEQAKKKQGGEAADLSDEDLEGVEP